ncbi:EamA family transporter RarD [Nevskia ramosa]|uniref:EamA family transporter RarD n=1 Tax=Nevskia ramosa TaxID=64002 RepID=UPI00235673F2|nr:EamA family transporter RarD [Nevskia ramosa]
MNTSAAAAPASFNRGILAVVGAFLIWGLLPLYLKPMHEVPALKIMSHRLLWCCLFVMTWLAWRGQLRNVRMALADGPTRLRLFFTALLISVNWIVYVWGVNSGHVLETSLGYFINPLVNVLLGVVILRERLNKAQWTAVAFAGLGVAWLTIQTGKLPWIALSLAISFGLYGLIRKLVKVDAIAGLGAETLLIAPFAAIYLGWLEYSGQGAFSHSTLVIDLMLFAGGFVTAIPLALFAFGARIIPYSTVGLIQYIGPTMQLLLGIFLYHEPFTATRAIGFAMIWMALVIYGGDGLLRSRRRPQEAVATAVPPEAATIK